MSTLIIGGGVAGTCAALTLAQRGIGSPLLDAGEFPHHKVCGEFFSPESRTVLQRLGVEKTLLQNGARLVKRARIVTARRELSLPLPGAALAISRYRMDEILWRAARRAGVLARDKTRVSAANQTANGWKIEAGQDSFAADTLLLAAGRKKVPGLEPSPKKSKVPARFFGLKAHFRDVRLEPGTVELHLFSGGYCGLVGIEDGLTNICLLARYESWDEVEERSPQAFWEWMLRTLPALNQRVAGAGQVTPWLATGNVSFGHRTPMQNGVFCIGDAAGYIHPLAGDGMAMAARSGELAATVIAAQKRGNLNSALAASLYQSAWKREFATRLRWAARVETLLTRPQLTASALTFLMAWPQLARRIAARTRGM